MNYQSDFNEAPPGRYTVPSVRTAINILNFLKASPNRRSSLSDICKGTGLSKSSAFTVLKTLQHADFVSYHEGGKKYSLGLALLELGGVVASEMDDVAVARPFVRDLASQSQETCIIVRWIKGQFIVLHCEEPQREVRVTAAIGQPFHHITGALGKAYLAFADDKSIRQVLKEVPLQASTPHSITEVGEFMKELDKCRRLGYAEGYEEAILGINAVASPVFDRNSRVVLVVSILGFSSSLSPELMRLDGTLVREAAARITTALGGQDNLGRLEPSTR